MFFIHAVLNMAFELGWRRIESFTQNLPECDKDKDFSRVTRLGANDEIGGLLKGKEATTTTTTGSKKAVILDAKMDVKAWFRCYELTEDHLFDHIVKIEDDETDNWSINTGSTSSSSSEQRPRGDSSLSVEGINSVIGSPTNPTRRVRSNSSQSQNSIDHLFPHVGVPVRKGKPRSDSAVSAITADGNTEEAADTNVNDTNVDLSSLKFALET